MQAVITNYANYKDPDQRSSLRVQIDKSRGGINIRIETLRLDIHSVTPEDLQNYQTQLYGDPEVMGKVSYGVTKDAATVEKRFNGTWVPRFRQGNPFSALAIYDKTTRQFIGHVMLRQVSKEVSGQKVAEPGVTEIHYLIAKGQQGNRYATEAASAVIYGLLPRLIKDGFTHGGEPIRKIFGTARKDNAGSWKILEKLMDFKEEKDKYNGVRRFYELDASKLMKS